MPDHGVDPAAATAAAALADDPFYRSICGASAGDPARRRALLTRYFAYSIREGAELGRAVHLDDPSLGVAVWALPQAPDARRRAVEAKHAFLKATLDVEGWARYDRMVTFMGANAAPIVDDAVWYLSILAVEPKAQGRGLGQRLVAPTLAEADRAGARCYLETFNSRAHPFYGRLGFVTHGRFAEPVTGEEYVLMVRAPGGLAP